MLPPPYQIVSQKPEKPGKPEKPIVFLRFCGNTKNRWFCLSRNPLKHFVSFGSKGFYRKEFLKKESTPRILHWDSYKREPVLVFPVKDFT